MPDIFINYRTQDTEQAAAAIDADLVHRFGPDRVFFAGRSIQPSRRFDTRILDAVSNSRVLISLIGPDWLAHGPQGRPRLFEDEDWVRREISVALRDGVHVLPALVGRRTERIAAHELPADIQGLSRHQTMRYDSRDSATFRTSLARTLIDLIPGLVDRSLTEHTGPGDREGGRAGQARNSVSGVTVTHGSVFQVGDGDLRHHTNENSYNNNHSTTNTGQFAGVGNISGELSGTFINESHGPVNSGSGPMHLSPDRSSTGQKKEEAEQRPKDSDRA